MCKVAINIIKGSKIIYIYAFKEKYFCFSSFLMTVSFLTRLAAYKHFCRDLSLTQVDRSKTFIESQ